MLLLQQGRTGSQADPFFVQGIGKGYWCFSAGKRMAGRQHQHQLVYPEKPGRQAARVRTFDKHRDVGAAFAQRGNHGFRDMLFQLDPHLRMQFGIPGQ